MAFLERLGVAEGKDTFAEEFAKLSPIPCQRHAFGDKVKETIELLTGYDMKEFCPNNNPFYNEIYNYTQEDKNVFLPLWDKTIGESLQIIGTDALRNRFDSDVWVKALFSTVGKETLEMGHILLIPDVRFENEANYILENGGILVRLEGDPANIRENSRRDLMHESEISLDDYEYFTYILESVNFKQLHENIEKILKTII